MSQNDQTHFKILAAFAMDYGTLWIKGLTVTLEELSTTSDRVIIGKPLKL